MEWYLKVLSNYATFTGRARRKEYWMFALISTLISIILVIIGHILFGQEQGATLSNLYSLGVMIPTIAVGIRRMHDINRSGWWILFPFVNLYFLCCDTVKGDNRYGHDPKLLVKPSPVM